MIARLSRVAALLALATLAACTANAATTQGIEPAKLTAAIVAAPKHQITLRSLLPDDATATTAVVVCPFQSVETTKRALGFNWQGAADVNTNDETTNAVILSDGRQVVGVSRIERTSVNLCAGTESGATFAVDDTLTFAQAANTDATTAWTLKR